MRKVKILFEIYNRFYIITGDYKIFKGKREKIDIIEYLLY